MTNPIARDELGLAEAVAAGELSLREAEDELRGAPGAGASDAAVGGLHRTIDAIEAVRAHALATRDASRVLVAPDRGARVVQSAQGDSEPPQGREPGRPRVVTAVVGGPVRARSRRVQDGRMLAVAATLVIVGGALGLAFAGNRSAPPSPRPTDASLATNERTARPAETAAAAVDASDALASVVQFTPTSASVGWVRTADGILRTADGGRTWTVMAGVRPGLTRFVDDRTAYVLIQGTQGSGTTVASTHDGGATWQPVALRYVPAGAIFVGLTVRVGSPEIAYATAYRSETSTDLAIYGTTDGGATWLGPNIGTVAVLSPEFNKFQGGENGLLWLSLGKADDAPFDNRFAVSSDGGHTWETEDFPLDSTFPTESLKAPISEGVIGAGLHSVSVLALGSADAVGIYTRRITAPTWSQVRTWPDAESIQLSATTDWTTVTADTIWSSADAGATWRTTPRPADLPLRGITFATPDVGWAEIVCGHPSWATPAPSPDPVCQGRTTGAILMATADGGATWTPMGQ
jgi:photosystem II stability/assembly factor-like uncharacterized protein